MPEKKQAAAWQGAVAGAIGNAFSRTAIAPLERTRMQMIADPGACSAVAPNRNVATFAPGSAGRLTMPCGACRQIQEHHQLHVKYLEGRGDQGR